MLLYLMVATLPSLLYNAPTAPQQNALPATTLSLFRPPHFSIRLTDTHRKFGYCGTHPIITNIVNYTYGFWSHSVAHFKMLPSHPRAMPVHIGAVVYN